MTKLNVRRIYGNESGIDLLQQDTWVEAAVDEYEVTTPTLLQGLVYSVVYCRNATIASTVQAMVGIFRNLFVYRIVPTVGGYFTVVIIGSAAEVTTAISQEFK